MNQAKTPLPLCEFVAVCVFHLNKHFVESVTSAAVVGSHTNALIPIDNPVRVATLNGVNAMIYVY